MKKKALLPLAGTLFLAISCGAPCDDKDTDPLPLTFKDVTGELFSGVKPTGSNVTVADINGDGYPDFALTAGTNELGDFKILKNEQGKRFTDVTAASGLTGQAATFIIFADVDNDGDQDALLVVNNQEGDESDYNTNLYLNDGGGHFSIVHAGQFGKGVQPDISVAVTDFNHDGLVDFFIAKHYARYGYLDQARADRLYMNEGQGHFRDVTKEAGLFLSGFTSSKMAAGLNPKPSWGASGCDLNDDGFDELLVSTYGRQFNDLFVNDFAGSGVFYHSGIDNGVASDNKVDFSDNLYYICYCSVHSEEAVCDGAYSIAAANCAGMTDYWYPGSDDQPYRLGGNSSNFLCGDLDDDGDIDLVSVELMHEHIGQSSDRTEILLNQGFPKPFVRPGNDITGLVRTHKEGEYFNEGDLAGALADLDNDGRLDVLVASSDYPGTRLLLWQQQADGTFKEVARSVGLSLPRAHGLGLIDYDRDGDLDLLVGTSLMRWAKTDDPPAPDAAYLYIFRNDTKAQYPVLRLKLVGSGDGHANRDGIGAKVTVLSPNVGILVRQRQGAHGLTGIQHDAVMTIGFSSTQCSAERDTVEVLVRWPNSKNSEVQYRLKKFSSENQYTLYEDGRVEVTENTD